MFSSVNMHTHTQYVQLERSLRIPVAYAVCTYSLLEWTLMFHVGVAVTVAAAIHIHI